MKSVFFALVALAALHPKLGRCDDNINTLVDAIYVISLDRSPERFEFVKNQFDKLDILIKRFSAVDGRFLELTDQETGEKFPAKEITFPNAENKTYRVTYSKNNAINADFSFFASRKMSAGELGCFMSHRAVWADVIKNKHKRAIILEDDVLLHDNFKKNLATILKNIPKNMDLVFLDFGIKKLSFRFLLDSIFNIDSRYFYKIKYSKVLWGTQAYLVNYNGAKKLLGRTSFIDRPIDLVIAHDPCINYCVSKVKLISIREDIPSEIDKIQSRK